MSKTFREIVLRSDGETLPEALRGFKPVRLGESPAGWVHWRMRRDAYFYLHAFEELLRAIGRETQSAVLGLYVETSDFGYVCGLLGEHIEARAVANRASAPGFENGAWATRKLEDEYGDDWPSRSVDSLVAWAEHAPRALSTEEAEFCLEADWVAPEDGIQELKRLLGLPDPPGAWNVPSDPP